MSPAKDMTGKVSVNLTAEILETKLTDSVCFAVVTFQIDNALAQSRLANSTGCLGIAEPDFPQNMFLGDSLRFHKHLATQLRCSPHPTP